MRRMTLYCCENITCIIKRNNRKNKLESHRKICENKYFCNIVMTSEDTKILEFNQYKKSDETQFIIYADLRCLKQKNDGCKNNPENSSATKASKHISLSFPMSTILSFESIDNKHDVYRSNDCTKKFCEPLREQVMETINFEKKKNKLLTNEWKKSYQNVKICYICKEKFEDKHAKD